MSLTSLRLVLLGVLLGGAAAPALAQPAPPESAADSLARSAPSGPRTAVVLGAGAGAAGYELFRRRVLDPRPHAPFEVAFEGAYARWADKPGHAFSTQVQAQLWAAAYRWAGHEPQAAALLGAPTGFAGMAYYEVLDGFDRGVGFDPSDIAANAAGAALVAAHAYWPDLGAAQLKWSYWPSGDGCDPSCDYEGQTAWLAINPHALAPDAAKRVLPPWLNVAVGYGARGGDVRAGFEESVVYLGLDFEPAGLPFRGKVWDALVPWLRLVHLPAPALRLSPDLGFEGFAY